MTQQSKPRDICECMDAWKSGQLHARRVEASRHGNKLVVLRVAHPPLFERGAVDTDAQPFPEHELIARLCPRIALEAARIDDSDGDEPVDRLDRVNAVTSSDRNARAPAR